MRWRRLHGILAAGSNLEIASGSRPPHSDQKRSRHYRDSRQSNRDETVRTGLHECAAEVSGGDCVSGTRTGHPERSEAESKDPDEVTFKLAAAGSLALFARDDYYVHLNISSRHLKLAGESGCFVHCACGFTGRHRQTNRTRQRNRTHSFDSASMGDSHPWATRGLVTR